MPEIVVTLLARPEDGALLAATVERIAREINGRIDWLTGAACDLVTDGAIGSVRDTLARRLDNLPLDCVVQPVAIRRKHLLVADMDSTVIGQECIDELADFVGKKSEISAITERSMRGELPFEPALRERVRLLAGLPVGVVAEVLATRISANPGARQLVATMRANGAHTALVSGGFTVFTGPVAALLGFESHYANTLLVDAEGRLTGRVAEPILGREAKLETLQRLRKQLEIGSEDTLAIGDGANDIAMVAAAGLGVAYRGKPALAAVAGARIDHTDLTALLFAQGYRQGEFAGG